MTHAKAPRNGGVTNEAMIRCWIVRRQGRSVRAVSQASGAPIASDTTPDHAASTSVFHSAFCRGGSESMRA